MSYPIVIPWLGSNNNLDVIASLQTLADAGSLVINSNVPALPQGPYIYDRVIRQVSFTSANNLNGIQLTITGIGSPVDANGNPTQVLAPIIETILNGPNINTINSANIYSRIISIATNGAANGISAGFGEKGITDYVFLDYNRTMFQASVQLQFVAHTNLLATVYQTLTKPETPNIEFGNLDTHAPLPAFAVSADMTGASTNQIANLLAPVSVVWANMSATERDSLYFTVLQQGIR